MREAKPSRNALGRACPWCRSRACCARCERPHRHRAAEQRDELASSYAEHGLPSRKPAVPAYRRLRMPRKRPQVLGPDLNRSGAESGLLTTHSVVRGAARTDLPPQTSIFSPGALVKDHVPLPDTPSHVSRSRIFDLTIKTVVFLRRARISKHHHGVPRSRHQVVVLFDNLPVPAVIETKLVPPIV